MNESAPPIIPTQPTQSQSVIQAPKNRGWMWISFFLMICLLGGGLCLLIIGMLGLNSGQYDGGTNYTVETIRDNGGEKEIAVIDLNGVIASFSVDANGHNQVLSLKRQFKWANDDDNVVAILLRINSPGGEVLASDNIADFVRESEKPVISVMGSVAASGGYYVAAPSDWIVAHELTITGSIGVIMSGYSFRNLMDKVGVQPIVFKSGKNKDMLSMNKREEDISQEERDIVQDMIGETFGRFKKVVQDGRNLADREGEEGRSLSKDWEAFADGRILSGTTALEQGFIDELGDFDTGIERAIEIVGLSEANVIRYQQPMNFSMMFPFLGKNETKQIKIDWGVEIPKLKAGRLYFLSPTLLY